MKLSVYLCSQDPGLGIRVDVGVEMGTMSRIGQNFALANQRKGVNV